MRSPFPGMDPFLESPGIFPDFHDRFIAYFSEALQPSLPEPYFAALGRRAWVEVSERFIGPDVSVNRSTSANSVAWSGSTAAATTGTLSEPVVVHVPHDEQVETLVEIYAGRGNDRRLVTAIELLSPANKTPGERGRELYLRKSEELLNSKTHLVEIDLLRAGVHTTAVPKDYLLQKIQPTPYHVCIHRFDRFEDFFVYPIALHDSLPTIAIPLLPGDGDVSISLQQVFQRTYAAGPYFREIDYADDVPAPSLSDMELEWVKRQLGGRSSVDR